MINLYSGLLLPVDVTATSAQATYPATNVRVPSIDVPWRATSAANNSLTIDLGADRTIRCIAINGCNEDTVAVLSASTIPALASRGNLLTYADRHGRRRGILAMNQTHRYVRLDFAGSPSDGLPYWWVGGVYLMGTVNAIVSPSVGYEVKTLKPGVMTKLPNGLTTKPKTGPNRDMISMTWEPQDFEVVAPAMNLPDSDTCVLDMGLPNYPHQVWPVRTFEEETAENFYAVKNSRVRRDLMELC
jgi:hypothetical protein